MKKRFLSVLLVMALVCSLLPVTVYAEPDPAKEITRIEIDGLEDYPIADCERALDSITREQLAAILYRCEQKLHDGGFKGAWMFNLDCTDEDQISDWAGEAVHWCVMNGILSGSGGGRLAPGGTATRAQAAQMLLKYLGR